MFSARMASHQDSLFFQDAAELYSTVEKLLGKPVVEDALPPGKVARNFSQLLRLLFLRLGVECAKRVPQG